jgi:hypothetical protein
MKRIVLSVIALLALCATFADAQEMRWYKGNLHTHTLWSDGDDFPEMAALMYRDNGYNFLALSDHNILSDIEKWMPVRKVRERGGDPPLTKYKAKFPEVVQTRTSDQGEEVRLQPLDVVRKLTEKPGEFIMIQSEEISARWEAPKSENEPAGATTKKSGPVHMNATNIAEVIKPIMGTNARDVIQANLQQVLDQAKRLNRPIVPHVNHPNFMWGITAEELASVVEERFFEIYNGHPGINYMGDATHPSMERVWDIGSTIRVAQLNTDPQMGLATDDTHHYHVPGMKRSTALRGWIMVRAGELTPDSISRAILDGNFYASSGVTLEEVTYDKDSKTLRVKIKPDGDAVFTTRFVGTPKNFADGAKTPLDSDKVGITFKSQDGTSAEYKLTGEELFVRAVITSNRPPANPSFDGQLQMAWTQPVR